MTSATRFIANNILRRVIGCTVTQGRSYYVSHRYNVLGSVLNYQGKQPFILSSIHQSTHVQNTECIKRNETVTFQKSIRTVNRHYNTLKGGKVIISYTKYTPETLKL